MSLWSGGGRVFLENRSLLIQARVCKENEQISVHCYHRSLVILALIGC